MFVGIIEGLFKFSVIVGIIVFELLTTSAFAKEEKELFKFLFMRNARVDYNPSDMDWQKVVDMAQKSSGVNKDNSELFHLEMWIVVHGIATMQATGYMDVDVSLASRILTDTYNGLAFRFNGGNDGCNKN